MVLKMTIERRGRFAQPDVIVLEMDAEYALDLVRAMLDAWPPPDRAADDANELAELADSILHPDAEDG